MSKKDQLFPRNAIPFGRSQVGWWHEKIGGKSQWTFEWMWRMGGGCVLRKGRRKRKRGKELCSLLMSDEEGIWNGFWLDVSRERVESSRRKIRWKSPPLFFKDFLDAPFIIENWVQVYVVEIELFIFNIIKSLLASSEYGPRSKKKIRIDWSRTVSRIGLLPVPVPENRGFPGHLSAPFFSVDVELMLYYKFGE